MQKKQEEILQDSEVLVKQAFESYKTQAMKIIDIRMKEVNDISEKHKAIEKEFKKEKKKSIVLALLNYFDKVYMLLSKIEDALYSSDWIDNITFDADISKDLFEGLSKMIFSAVESSVVVANPFLKHLCTEIKGERKKKIEMYTKEIQEKFTIMTNEIAKPSSEQTAARAALQEKKIFLNNEISKKKDHNAKKALKSQAITDYFTEVDQRLQDLKKLIPGKFPPRIFHTHLLNFLNALYLPNEASYDSRKKKLFQNTKTLGFMGLFGGNHSDTEGLIKAYQFATLRHLYHCLVNSYILGFEMDKENTGKGILLTSYIKSFHQNRLNKDPELLHHMELIEEKAKSKEKKSSPSKTI